MNKNSQVKRCLEIIEKINTLTPLQAGFTCKYSGSSAPLSLVPVKGEGNQ